MMIIEWLILILLICGLILHLYGVYISSQIKAVNDQIYKECFHEKQSGKAILAKSLPTDLIYKLHPCGLYVIKTMQQEDRTYKYSILSNDLKTVLTRGGGMSTEAEAVEIASQWVEVYIKRLNETQSPKHDTDA